MDTASRLQGAVQSITSIFVRKPRETVQPLLSNPVRYPFGEFEFHLHSTARHSLELQVSRDFRRWESLETITPAKEASVVSDKKAGGSPALFYRAVAEEGGRSNYIGFVSFDIPPGYSLISNPLHSEFTTVTDLFPAVPEGCFLQKFGAGAVALEKNSYSNGKWSNGTETLGPGEGALFLNPADQPVRARFVGEVPLSQQSIDLHPGKTVLSSLLPLAGRLDSDLGFPFAPGDTLTVYNNAEGRYLDFSYTENGWVGEVPVLRLGEAFSIVKKAAATWKQQLPDG